MRRLSEALVEKGHGVIATREPGGTSLGEEVRSLLLGRKEGVRIGARAELLLFLAARVQHIEEVIVPALQEGNIVICDRFNDSTVAYQGAARGLGVERVQQMCTLACGELLPSLTLFLDVDPELGLRRSQSAQGGHLDRIEKEQIAFHQKVRAAMQELAKREPERIRTLDSSRSIDELFEEAFAIVTQTLARADVL